MTDKSSASPNEAVHEQVVIIGAGAAGLTAGIYTARANLSPVIIAGLQPGGQMTITTDVENYPGFAEVIQGPWLMTEMQSQAENVGARVIYDLVTDLDTSARPFRMKLDSGKVMTADVVILATGAQARWLGLESESAFNGRGVSACATCDGFFYKERDVAVIGGGNTAVEEALYLYNQFLAHYHQRKGKPYDDEKMVLLPLNESFLFFFFCSFTSITSIFALTDLYRRAITVRIYLYGQHTHDIFMYPHEALHFLNRRGG